MLRVFWDLDGVAKRDQGGVARVFGHEDRGEVLVGDTRPMERSADGVASGDALDGETFELLWKYAQGAVGRLAVDVLDAAGGVGGRTNFIPETGRPHGEGGDD